MRELLVAADGGHERSALAIEVYLHRLRASVAAMAAAMGGIDALAFTGGVGEGSTAIRARACELGSSACASTASGTRPRTTRTV